MEISLIIFFHFVLTNCHDKKAARHSTPSSGRKKERNAYFTAT